MDYKSNNQVMDNGIHSQINNPNRIVSEQTHILHRSIQILASFPDSSALLTFELVACEFKGQKSTGGGGSGNEAIQILRIRESIITMYCSRGSTVCSIVLLYCVPHRTERESTIKIQFILWEIYQ